MDFPFSSGIFKVRRAVVGIEIQTENNQHKQNNQPSVEQELKQMLNGKE